MRAFISHSTRDAPFIEQELLPLLKRHGVAFWYSREAIRTTEEWERQIYVGIDSCDWFIVVLSPAAVASRWVSVEVAWALENRRGNVIPILLKTCDVARLNHGLTAIQHADYRASAKKGRAKVLQAWGMPEIVPAGLTEIGKTLSLIGRGIYWRQKRALLSATSAATLLICLFAATVAMAQDPIARRIATGIPLSLCRSESIGSAVQVFDKGWLIARAETGQFFAVADSSAGKIGWHAFTDDYKSGTDARCAHGIPERLLTAGFRKLYCEEHPELFAQLGLPRAPETHAYLEFQDWSGGLLIFGVPGTAIGFDGDYQKFSRLDALFLNDDKSRRAGNGFSSGWSESTSTFPDECSALWYRTVVGGESPQIASLCRNKAPIRHAATFVDGWVACQRV